MIKLRNISEIIDFLKDTNSLSKDNEIAKLLKMNGPALSNHKIKGTIPYPNLIKFCYKNNISLDFVLTDNPPNPTRKIIQTPIDNPYPQSDNSVSTNSNTGEPMSDSQKDRFIAFLEVENKRLNGIISKLENKKPEKTKSQGRQKN